MLRHAVKLHTNPRMKEIAETWKSKTVYWDGAIGYKGLEEEEKDLTQSSLRAEHRGHREGRLLIKQFAHIISLGRAEKENTCRLGLRFMSGLWRFARA